MRPFAERFWARVDKSGECWIWKGQFGANGYGQMGRGKRAEGNVYAHRAPWEINRGPIPPGLLVLHKCDNRARVNPDHLFLGTQKENMADMIRKGRSPHDGFRLPRLMTVKSDGSHVSKKRWTMPFLDRFWSAVKKTEHCWEWTGYTGSTGYGSIKRDGRLLSAHRVSWEIHYGPIPAGLWALHRSDNRCCVRPDHLFLGTPADNHADMDAKGRRGVVFGEGCYNAKLSNLKVLAARQLLSAGISQSVIAAKLDVCQNTISKINLGLSWKHVRESASV